MVSISPLLPVPPSLHPFLPDFFFPFAPPSLCFSWEDPPGPQGVSLGLQSGLCDLDPGIPALHQPQAPGTAFAALAPAHPGVPRGRACLTYSQGGPHCGLSRPPLPPPPPVRTRPRRWLAALKTPAGTQSRASAGQRSGAIKSAGVGAPGGCEGSTSLPEPGIAHGLSRPHRRC